MGEQLTQQSRTAYHQYDHTSNKKPYDVIHRKFPSETIGYCGAPARVPDQTEVQ